MLPLILCLIGSITWIGSLSQFAASLLFLVFVFFVFSTCTCIGRISVGRHFFWGCATLHCFVQEVWARV